MIVSLFDTDFLVTKQPQICDFFGNHLGPPYGNPLKTDFPKIGPHHGYLAHN